MSGFLFLGVVWGGGGVSVDVVLVQYGAELILKVGSSPNIYCLIYAFGLKFQAR